jgi:hypothetical protein
MDYTALLFFLQELNLIIIFLVNFDQCDTFCYYYFSAVFI